MDRIDNQNSEISQLMQYLAPWLEKTDGEGIDGLVGNHNGHEDDGEVVGTVADSGESRACGEDARILPPSGSRCNGVCTGGLCDDRHEDDV